MYPSGLPLSYPLLCEEGWRMPHQITPGMRALSLNPNTFSFVYSPVLEIIFHKNVPGIQISSKDKKEVFLECANNQTWWLAEDFANIRNMRPQCFSRKSNSFLFNRIEWGFSSERAIWVSECFFVDLNMFVIEEVILPEVWYPRVETTSWFTQLPSLELCITLNS